MKKIIIITAVKNESDIIESFCRYNLSYSDGILIYENYKSSDNTREIIQNLIGEGLPIYFEAEKKDIYYEEAKGLLLDIAAKKYEAGLVLQLDADEFLCHIDGKNPRETLENLKEDVEYQMKWRTYVYQHEPKKDCKFIPSGFTRYRNPMLEEAQGHAGKTIASRYLIRSKSAKFAHGGHWLDYPQEFKEDAKIEELEELVCAHYPIRSKKQVMSKAIPNFINKWTMQEHQRPVRSTWSQQLATMFDSIKEHGEITTDAMKEISITYSLGSHLADKKRIKELLRNLGKDLLLEKEIDTAFCADNLIMKYTGRDSRDNKAFMRATLSITDDALQHLDTESRNKTQQNAELTQQNAELTQLLNTFESQAEQLIARYG